MGIQSLNLLLADDDVDDCFFFAEAVKDLPFVLSLQTVNNGDQLMGFLIASLPAPPDILFLDLNMPRKNGFECLEEIKANETLKHLPVIIYSTSFDHTIVNLLYEKGAHLYIRKAGEFSKLKKSILEAIKITSENSARPVKEKFVIEG